MGDNGRSGDHMRPLSADSVVVSLPTELVVHYRAVDREYIGAPIAIVDTPAHLDALTASVREHGILVPLRLGFNAGFGFLDGNHRIAVALRLGLPEVPVELVKEAADLRKDHGRPMRPEDLTVLVAAFEEVTEIRSHRRPGDSTAAGTRPCRAGSPLGFAE